MFIRLPHKQIVLVRLSNKDIYCALLKRHMRIVNYILISELMSKKS